MALPRDLLEGAELTEAMNGVRDAVQRVRGAQSQVSDSMTKAEALLQLEAVTDRWLKVSGQLENRLREFLPREPPGLDDEPDPSEGVREDTGEAVERLCALSYLSLAVASDLARLAPIDVLADEMPVNTAELPPEDFGPFAIDAVGGGGPDDAGLSRAISLSEDQANAEDSDPIPGLVTASQVLDKLVGSGGKALSSVLIGSAPSPHVVFGAVRPALEWGLGVTAKEVADAAKSVGRSVARLVMLIFSRVRELVNAVSRGYAQVIGEMIRLAQPEELLLRPVTRRIAGVLLRESSIQESITHYRTVRKQAILKAKAPHIQLPGTPPRVPHSPVPPATQPKQDDHELRKLIKRNKRWVGRPVPIVARTLHPLWAVPIGPVPAAPVAAAVVVVWTVVVTAAQLNAPGYPSFGRTGLVALVARAETPL
jgi:hypothetical protein